MSFLILNPTWNYSNSETKFYKKEKSQCSIPQLKYYSFRTIIETYLRVCQILLIGTMFLPRNYKNFHHGFLIGSWMSLCFPYPFLSMTAIKKQKKVIKLVFFLPRKTIFYNIKSILPKIVTFVKLIKSQKVWQIFFLEM